MYDPKFQQIFYFGILMYPISDKFLKKFTGSPLHCQVEHHVRDKQNLFFLSYIIKMGQIFFKSRYTRYLLHTKNS
jgi:hypothetical protein